MTTSEQRQTTKIKSVCQDGISKETSEKNIAQNKTQAGERERERAGETENERQTGEEGD